MKKSEPLFQQNNLFWFINSTLNTHLSTLITSSPVQPKNHSRAYPARAREETVGINVADVNLGCVYPAREKERLWSAAY